MDRESAEDAARKLAVALGDIDLSRLPTEERAAQQSANIVLGCSPVPPVPPAGIKYVDMDASQKRAAIVAILMGHSDDWRALESSRVRVVCPPPPPPSPPRLGCAMAVRD